MKFTKIKRGDRVELAWLPACDSENDEREQTLRSYDTPKKEFGEAMDALVPHVLKLLELPAEYGEGLKVTSLSISYQKAHDDRMGVVITCLKSIAGAVSPVVFNTPYLAEFDLD